MEDQGLENRDDAWERLAKNMLRAELMRRGLSYAGLAEALAAIGVRDTEANLRNKVGRGRFTAVFFLQCLVALDLDWLRVPLAKEMESATGDHGAQAIAAIKPSGPPPIRGAFRGK